MADITKCYGKGCNRKEYCFRFTAKDNPLWQSYSNFSPYDCDNFIQDPSKETVLTFSGSFFDLDYALSENIVKASSNIRRGLACLAGENDGPAWHWLVELENGNVAYLTGWCDYTGWDCRSGVTLVNEYKDLNEALSPLGLPTLDTDSDRQIREEFKNILK